MHKILNLCVFSVLLSPAINIPSNAQTFANPDYSWSTWKSINNAQQKQWYGNDGSRQNRSYSSPRSRSYSNLQTPSSLKKAQCRDAMKGFENMLNGASSASFDLSNLDLHSCTEIYPSRP